MQEQEAPKKRSTKGELNRLLNYYRTLHYCDICGSGFEMVNEYRDHRPKCEADDGIEPK